MPSQTAPTHRRVQALPANSSVSRASATLNSTSQGALLPREWVLLLACAALLAVAVFGPDVAAYVPHSAHAHAFADQRRLLGLSNALDVLSNLPFLIVAGLGWRALLALPEQALGATQRALCHVFFGGLALTSLGSSLYHALPSAATLVWDRLGMAVAFAGLLGLACAQRISLRAGLGMAVFALAGALASVWVWQRTGHVLPWAVVQFGGMAVVLALACLRGKGMGMVNLWLVIAAYAAAKLLEGADHAVYNFTEHLVSGHTLKHLSAAVAAWPVLVWLEQMRAAR
jgi:hypothetical protein